MIVQCKSYSHSGRGAIYHWGTAGARRNSGPMRHRRSLVEHRRTLVDERTVRLAAEMPPLGSGDGKAAGAFFFLQESPIR